MAHPLLLLGLITGSGVGTGMVLSKNATQQPDLTARFGSVPATPLMAGGGALLAFMGGPLLAPIGIGMLVGSLVGWDNMRRVKEGLDTMVAGMIQKQLAQGGAKVSQIPEIPPAPPAGPAGGQLLTMLSPLTQP